MIGSHDTYTYLRAKSLIARMVSKFWRCQEKDLQDLYVKGVRFFDIRIFRKNGKWYTAHGIAEFEQHWDSIFDICNFFRIIGVKYRIWLEKGSDNDWLLFCNEALVAKDKYDGFVQAVRKKGEIILFQKDSYPNMQYYCCKMEDTKNILKGLYATPIKDWAKKHNPEITLEMIDDPNICYFMDFV